MFRSTLLVALTLLSYNSAAQVILFMNWDNNPVSTANIGPNPISISSSATSSANGTGGTNGLNPGSPKADINMVFTGSPTFDVNGIDLQIDFQRDESVGDFVTRTGFNWGMNGGNLSVSFRVDNGAGGYTNVNSGNVYSIPNDDVFRTYRFFYLPDFGTAELQVNGATIWSYAGTAGRNMYWSGGNLTIGNAMDGSGSNKTVLDNLVIASVTASPLPVELLSFDAKTRDSKVVLSWATASETNNNYFTIERSSDGIVFDEKIALIQGAGNSSNTIEYSCTDYHPLPGIAYYRLSQTDFDGVMEQFEPIKVSFENTDDMIEHITGTKKLTILSDNVDKVRVYDLAGREIQTTLIGNTIHLNTNQIGMFMVHIETLSGNSVSKKIQI